jgi:hypothetical protein
LNCNGDCHSAILSALAGPPFNLIRSNNAKRGQYLYVRHALCAQRSDPSAAL